MRIVIDISKDKYDEIMSMDWKNCRRFFDEEIRAIHDGKALEQEPCEDAISREAAIRAIEALQRPIMREASACYQFKFSGMSEAREVVVNLPPVNPKEPNTSWVPVSERLPGFGQTVLVTSDGDLYFEENGEGWKGKTTTVAYLTEEGWEMSDMNYECQMNKITAWQPLPEPYKKSEGREWQRG